MRLAAGVTLLLIIASPMAAADTLADRVAALTHPFKGRVAVYARNLTTGREFALDADARVRTASTIKLPILCALESLVALGRVRWDERIRLRPEDKVTGSGVLGSLEDGTDLTIRNLAILMIIVSDNTATNLITDRITADAVNEYLDSIGLTTTRYNRKVRGDGARLAEPSGWSRAGRLEENRKYGLGVSTPREMVRLLQMLEAGTIVSPAASKDILDILAKQQVRDGMARHAPDDLRIVSKSGALDALRSDVGIVYAKGGPIAMAITVDEMPVTDYSPDNVGNVLIWELATVLVEELGAH
ncbi:MAG TPA: serine hydrolase [Vicinamibacterales bacterium]|nr:serine hydrolase [Vicinamibacterales bacterium]